MSRRRGAGEAAYLLSTPVSTFVAILVVTLVVPLALAARPVSAGQPREAREILVATRNCAAPVPVLILVPPSYEAEPLRRYPVVYFLHDAGGSESVLVREGVADALFEEMRTGRLTELLVVAPRGVGTWWVDSWDGRSKMAAFLDEDLVPFVDASFRTIAARKGRAVAGISMGGYGALHWAFLKPGRFVAAGGLSPAVQQLNWRGVNALPFFLRPALHQVFGSSEAANDFRKDDLYDILLSRPAPGADDPMVFVRCGTQDKYRLAEITAFFRRYLDTMNVPNRLTLEPGRHDWTYWKKGLPALVRDLAGSFP